MRRLYGIIADHGDGSSGLRWCTRTGLSYFLSEENPDWEAYSCNEGAAATVIRIPEGHTPSSLGITVMRSPQEKE